MALFPRYALGMEWTDSLLKLVEMKRGFRRVRLMQYMVHPLFKEEMAQQSEVDREEWIQSVREALADRRFKTRNVHLALGNRHVVTAIWKIPEIDSNRMRRWIEKKVIPMWKLPFDDPYFDYQPIGHVWQEGDQQEVMVAAVSRSLVEERVDRIRCCGLEPVSIDLSALSLQRWLDYSDDSLLDHMATLQFFRNGVDVNLFHRGVFQGGRFVPFEMVRFMKNDNLTDMNSMSPMLADPEQIQDYGETLLEVLGKEGPEWMNLELWKKSRVWVLTGEGIDLKQLMMWLQSKETPPVRMATEAKNLMSEKLSLKTSRWLGTTLSVPLGAALTGVQSR
ncbi:type IV pilus biogenesis protein PilM [Melghirimyces algeriensis]|uniref:Tfp pilus assembly protein, ATPase PilM n=1 Tax=Melghirimyces algeriensis TaxID=910412 RepID=A0A521EQP9_9BACL|nr:pilus assembly protein PilM [Melghirimyces algeriensis]SMO85741.1 Tfp pilus assembly protein, ATPase PilM [Melghirimyces algeriensis]